MDASPLPLRFSSANVSSLNEGSQKWEGESVVLPICDGQLFSPPPPLPLLQPKQTLLSVEEDAEPCAMEIQPSS